MSKIKPNEPCPVCGSGKKYKKCCGVKNIKMSSPRPNNPKLEGTWGLSGTKIDLSITRASSDPTNPMNFAKPGGDTGVYKVSFTLSKPNYAPSEENQVSIGDGVMGDSHVFIRISTDIKRIEFHANLPEGNFLFFGYTNEKGCLGKIEIENIQAINFKDASWKAYNALSPILSRISLLSDCPIHVYQTHITEVKTQNYMIDVNLPYLIKTPSIFENYELDKNLSQFTSLYREALNSNSPNYQYLCFYKIIEGIRNLIEKRTRKENKKYLDQGKKPPSKSIERIPTDKNEQIEWLNAIFTKQRWSQLALDQVFIPEITGRKLSDVINTSKELDTVRNKIAHTILRDEKKETYNFDEGIHVSEVYKWLPLCKCLAIYLLKKEYPKLFKV